jgi:acetylornithine/N-succinyldiaminopimelate aminotransferase
VTAVLDEMRRLDAPTLATERGALLTDRLSALAQVVAVRGSGLMLGAQLADGIDAPTVYRSLIANGLICNAVDASTLRFLPPLTVTDAEIDEAVAILARVLDEVAA